ncbi:MAG: 4'-phosphopantetheinyl transferase family protein [Cytophagales bacterium]
MLRESEQIHHPTKRKEFLASRLVLAEICKQQSVYDLNIFKTIHGKPFFPESKWHFSISHTEKYAVCAIHLERPIGIDTEKIQSKFEIIAQKFLTDDEQKVCENDIGKIALRWCIKESAYKWNGEKGLNFKTEIVIDSKMNEVLVKDIKNNIHFEKIDEDHFWAIVY